MSEVDQVIPDLAPELSGEDSVRGPVILERSPTEILNLVPENALCFIGSADKLTINEWLGYTAQWMDFVRIPQELWTDVAATLLREGALLFWDSIKRQRKDYNWSVFGNVMKFRYKGARDEKVWYRVMKRFHQRLG